MTLEMLIKNNMGSVPRLLGKPLYSDNSTCLIWAPVNADNRHLFLAQSTDSRRKTTSLMQTLHYQLCAVISLSFLKGKKPSVDCISMFPALQFTGSDYFWHQTSYAENGFLIK